MEHLTNIQDIEQTIRDHSLCLFYIKAPDCGVCNVMLDKVARLADRHPSLCAFYTDNSSAVTHLLYSAINCELVDYFHRTC